MYFVVFSAPATRLYLRRMHRAGPFKAQYLLKRMLAKTTHFFLLFSAPSIWAERPRPSPAPPAALMPERRPGYGNVTVQFSNFKETIRVTKAEPDFCRGIDLIALIPSRPTYGGLDARDEIRDTWLQKGNIPANFTYKFVIGLPQFRNQKRNERIRAVLEAEQNENKDLILYEYKDIYQELSVKTAVLLHWQQTYCPKARYVLKADDDTAIDLIVLRKQIEKWYDTQYAVNPLMAWGQVLANTSVIRDRESKWYISPEEFAPDLFPDYVNGAIYLITSQAVTKVLSVMNTTKKMPIEDALITGILAEKVGVERYHLDAFYPEYYTHEYCYDKVPLLAGVYGLSTGRIQYYVDWLHTIHCKDLDEKKTSSKTT